MAYTTVHQTQPILESWDTLMQEDAPVLKDNYYQNIKKRLDQAGVKNENSDRVGGIPLMIDGEWSGLITIEKGPFVIKILKNNDGESPHPKLEMVKKILDSFVSEINSRLKPKFRGPPIIGRFGEEENILPGAVNPGGKRKSRKPRKHRSRKVKKTRKH